MNTVRVIQVVETTLTRRGNGTTDDPVRVITEYWSLEGKKLAEVDPCRVSLTEAEIRKYKEKVKP